MSVELQSKRYETNSHETYRPGTLLANESRVMKIGWAHFRYLLWQVLTKLVFGMLYIGIVSEGARRLAPALGQRLCKLNPLVDRIDHRLDCAHLFALIVLFGTWWSWNQLLQCWLGVKPYSRETTVTVPLAFMFITTDAVIFYTATAQWRWGGSLVSFPSALMTVAYVAGLVFVTFVGIQLKEELRKEKS